jgi:hypothetical protein
MLDWFVLSSDIFTILTEWAISLIHLLVFLLVLLLVEVRKIEPLSISVVSWRHHRCRGLHILGRGLKIWLGMMLIILFREIWLTTLVLLLLLQIGNLWLLLYWGLMIIMHWKRIQIECWDIILHSRAAHCHCQRWLDLHIDVINTFLFVWLKTFVV